MTTSRIIPGFRVGMYSDEAGTVDTFTNGERTLKITSEDGVYKVVDVERSTDFFTSYRSALVYVMMRLQTS